MPGLFLLAAITEVSRLSVPYGIISELLFAEKLNGDDPLSSAPRMGRFVSFIAGGDRRGGVVAGR